ncbi:Serine-protein kinase RsbW [Paraconexibacter sp. AEG42_29]|uniref:Serine-protein kinase RsbW n=1 Tax=Paraconexibacter sp. AEG42_29 TaxID=2997339 RepID=A0AAU7AU13_9ACTN
MTTTTTFALSLPARPESLTVVRHVLGGITDVWAVSPELLDDVRIAVTEACSSVITHGDHGTGASMVEVQGSDVDGQLLLVVRSREPGLDASAGSPDLGLAMPLIGALTSSLEIGRSPDGLHEVRMTFPRDDA